MKKYIFNMLLWGVLLTGAFLVFNRVNSTPPLQDSLAYSDFINKVKQGQIDRVEMNGQMIKIRTSEGQNYETFNPGDPHLIDDLLDAKVQIRTSPPVQQSFLMQVFISWFPMLLLIAVWVIYMRRMQGGGIGGANNFGKSKAKMLEQDKLTATFDDVA
ncbi:MAG: ATP-dependent metallopeptidase FtsH/Yme1/Tma family protein, partial [Methylobacter sp.]